MLKLQLILFFFVNIFCVLQIYGFNISGRVINSGQQPVYGASCTVFTLPDSALYSISLTDREGRFNTETADSSAWYINISSIGYSTIAVESKFFIDRTDTDSLPTVVLSEQVTDLHEFVIKGRRPQLTQKNGVLHYNINDILNTQVVASVHDVLKHLPLLISSDGNALTLSGAPQGSVIYINSNPMRMDQNQIIEYLKSIPAGQLKDVEIIYNPSPKWQTRSAIINLVLKKTDAYSLNGMVSGYGIRQHKTSGGGRISLFAGLPRLVLNAMYSFDAGKSISKQTSFGRHKVTNGIYEISDTAVTESTSPSHNVYTSLGYEFNSRNSLEISYYGRFTPSGSSGLRTDNSLLGTYLSTTRSNSSLNSTGIVYNNSGGIRVGAEYKTYHRHNSQIIHNDNTPTPSEALNSEARQKVVTMRAYTDFTTPCHYNWTLMYGASFDFGINTNSLHGVSESENMESVSGESDIREKTGKLYFGAYRYLFANKLFVNTSLTGELYRISDYTNNQLLPRITLMYIPGTKHIFQAAYSSYRTYPPYWQRQNYSIYSSPYNLSLGNPLLKPVRYHTLNMMYLFDSRYSLSATYYRVNNFYLNQTYQSPETLIRISQPYNIDFSSTWDLMLNLPLNAGNFFTSNITVNGSWERFKSDDWHGISFDKSKFALRITAYTNFVLSQNPRISVNITGFYKTPSLAGLWTNGHAWLLNAGVCGSFFKDRVTVDFQATDILQSLYAVQTMRVATQYLDSDYNYYRRNFSLNLSYKFRGYREKEIRNPDSSRLGIN
ncbi:MAG: TonB-dependent receptor family protein [Muribaculaceae bacterium]|nr:TonB-dependent receptor family protein [Muribaculaceae bacterium]